MRSIEVFREHPWIGNGVGTWGYYVAREGRDVLTPPRNLVTAWLFEKGILGAVIGAILHLAIVARTAVGLRYADPGLRMLIWAPFVGWLAVLITFQFTVVEITPFYWTILGMLLAATDQSLMVRAAQRRNAPVQPLAASLARH
jgi:O-antigen ligase